MQTPYDMTRKNKNMEIVMDVLCIIPHLEIDH